MHMHQSVRICRITQVDQGNNERRSWVKCSKFEISLAPVNLPDRKPTCSVSCGHLAHKPIGIRASMSCCSCAQGGLSVLLDYARHQQDCLSCAPPVHHHAHLLALSATANTSSKQHDVSSGSELAQHQQLQNCIHGTRVIRHLLLRPLRSRLAVRQSRLQQNWEYGVFEMCRRIRGCQWPNCASACEMCWRI